MMVVYPRMMVVYPTTSMMGAKNSKDPHVRKDKPADASVAGAEEHVAIRPKCIDETLVPACALAGGGFQVGGYFSPASGVGNKVDVVRAVIFMQAAMHANRSEERRVGKECRSRW